MSGCMTSLKTSTPKVPRSIRAVVVPKRRTIRIGYVALMDAAPLLAAEALGYFERDGVPVTLSRQLGWGSIREQAIYGEIDAAHAPGGLLFSILCEERGGRPRQIATDLCLNLQGNAITLSRRLWEKGVRDIEGLRLMIRSESPRKPVFAVVSPYSSHIILLRQWLKSGGINPDSDVRIAVLPPPLVGEHMREGLIDGFCAGEPWNSEAVMEGDGWVVVTSATLAPLHPEKVFLASGWLMQTPEYAALRAAIVRACRWCDGAENRDDLVAILRERCFPKVSADALGNALGRVFQTGVESLAMKQPLLSFYRNDANAATAQKAAWFFDGLSEAGTIASTPELRRRALQAFRAPNQ